MMIVRWFSISLKYPVVWRLQRMTFSFQWKWLVIVWSLSLCLKHWISLGKQTSLNISKLNLRLLKVAITKCFPLIIIISSQCICKWIAMLMKVLDKLDDLLYTVSPKIGPFLFWTWLWQILCNLIVLSLSQTEINCDNVYHKICHHTSNLLVH